ncbi:hypothetical protein TNCV_3036531 [Trichonephila clavipes]|nr:hypothetical protein TNCV_3036531 [Trichonephila clavipes]
MIQYESPIYINIPDMGWRLASRAICPEIAPKAPKAKFRRGGSSDGAGDGLAKNSYGGESDGKSGSPRKHEAGTLDAFTFIFQSFNQSSSEET